MRAFFSVFVCVAALFSGLYIQREQIVQHMRSLLRQSTINQLSKTLKPWTTNSTAAMTSSKSFVGLPVIPPQDPSLNAASPVPRAIRQVFEAREQSEGAGATVRRSIGTAKLKNFTPFLMLDHFSVGEGAGFPDHPHRGQETITYVLSGGVDHEDFAGNRGSLLEGDLQFMTAGKGIVHAEMPHHNEDGSSNMGMQLWVDLPKDLKNCEPRYRDLRAAEIPLAKSDDGKVSVKVISGRSLGVDSLKELAYTPVWFLDATIQPGGKLDQGLPAGWNSFAYILQGNVSFDTGATSQVVPQFHNTVFEQKGDKIVASVPSDGVTARLIVVSGMPLDQPVVQYGPFVLTAPEQVRQAIMDFSTFQNGFERAENWQSEIGKSMVH